MGCICSNNRIQADLITNSESNENNKNIFGTINGDAGYKQNFTPEFNERLVIENGNEDNQNMGNKADNELINEQDNKSKVGVSILKIDLTKSNVSESNTNNLVEIIGSGRQLENGGDNKESFVVMSKPEASSYRNSFSQIDEKIKESVNVVEVANKSSKKNLPNIPNIKSNKKKGKKASYNDEMLEIINSFRVNPQSYLDKVKDLSQYVVYSKGKLILSKKGYPKIVLYEGTKAIDSVVELIEEMKPMSKLEYQSFLEIQVPDKPEEWTKYSSLVENKTNEIMKNKIKYKMFSFHFDMSISDPEFSFLIQLIDDNGFNGVRRSHICDPELKYIAITSKLIVNAIPDTLDEKKSKDKKFCSYFCFAK